MTAQRKLRERRHMQQNDYQIEVLVTVSVYDAKSIDDAIEMAEGKLLKASVHVEPVATKVERYREYRHGEDTEWEYD